MTAHLLATAAQGDGAAAARMALLAAAAVTIGLAVRLARLRPHLAPYPAVVAAVLLPSTLAAAADPPVWSWSLGGLLAGVVVAMTVTVANLAAAARPARAATPGIGRPPRLRAEPVRVDARR